LSFQAPEKNRFKYLLEGKDTTWIEAGSDRVAHCYTWLRPLPFRVIACNNDGVWNETGATLACVPAALLETWWFKLGMLAAAGLLLTAFYQARVSGCARWKSAGADCADLHDDVGARLTKVQW